MILHIRAVEACEVPKMDVIGLSDPYLKFELNTTSQKWKTKHVNNTKIPVWNEEFHLPITSSLRDVLNVSLWDKDDGSKDDLISTYDFKLNTDFEIGKVTDKWYQFQPAKGVKTGGKVRLIMQLNSLGKDPFIE